MRELEILAEQLGYRLADCLLLDGKWTVILDDEDGEIQATGETAQEAIEKMTARLVATISSLGH